MNLRVSKAATVRLAQGEPTIRDINAASLPENFRGKPRLDASRCVKGCSACVEACPTGAISLNPLTLDLGACVFCPLCTEACPEGAISYSNDYKMASTSRDALRLQERSQIYPEHCSEEIRRRFGRSLKLRSISAGGCNGCELELGALSNVNFDINRFGIEFVASPRHADGVVISGTTTRAMASALEATFEAVPRPKLLILFGACAISGGIFQFSDQLAREFIDRHGVDLYIPGCPPHPLTFVHGLLTYLRKLAAH